MLFGVERDVVVIELGQSLSVALPVEQARERLRPLASQTDLRRVEQTLAGTRGVGEGNWRQRLRVGQAKLAGGFRRSQRRAGLRRRTRTRGSTRTHTLMRWTLSEPAARGNVGDGA